MTSTEILDALRSEPCDCSPALRAGIDIATAALRDVFQDCGVDPYSDQTIATLAVLARVVRQGADMGASTESVADGFIHAAQSFLEGRESFLEGRELRG